MPTFLFDHGPLLLDFRRQFRAFHGPLTYEQGVRVNANFARLVSSVEEDEGWSTLPQIAYVFATAYHETAHDFEPKDEISRGRGMAYGESIPVMGSGHRVTQEEFYYGRGLVQLTWLANYAKASLLCGVDFISKPERVKEWPFCYQIMADGMRRGWFTGKSIGDYVNNRKTDYINARRVINGFDKTEQIAEYARLFELLLVKNAR